MANDPEHSEIIDTVVDVRMLEVVAEPDKKSSDAVTSSSVEEAEEENGKMEGVAEIPNVSRKLKGVIEEPADRMKDAATRSTMKQEKLENREVVMEIPEGFNLRNVEEINSYCGNQLKSQYVVRGDGGSGFYKVPDDMRQRQGGERLYDPTHINFLKVREMLENNDPDVDTRNLLSHYYYHFLGIHKINQGKKLEEYLVMIYENREEIARCYGVKEADIDFPHLFGLLLSSCFVVYLFYLPFHSPNEKDTECLQRWVNDLWVDLLVLENQIPFFVLERVFDKFKSEPSDLDMVFCTYNYFLEFVPLNWIENNLKPVHLLDFVHRSLLPEKQSDHRSFFTNLPIFRSFFTILSIFRSFLIDLPIFRSFFTNLSYFCYTIPALWWERYIARSRERPVRKVIPRATRLQEAGIQFRAVEWEGFVVEFKKGILRLPRLHIGKNTKKFFLNVIAWEQCHQPAVKYVINFAILMDHLINTSKDVEILIQNDVLENSLATEEEVATMFNSLGKDLIYTANEKNNEEYDFLMELSTELNDYCESRFNNWWAKLMSEYFSSPWTILSLIAALLIILLTLVQAYFSAYSYFRPPK